MYILSSLPIYAAWYHRRVLRSQGLIVLSLFSPSGNKMDLFSFHIVSSWMMLWIFPRQLQPNILHSVEWDKNIITNVEVQAVKQKNVAYFNALFQTTPEHTDENHTQLTGKPTVQKEIKYRTPWKYKSRGVFPNLISPRNPLELENFLGNSNRFLTITWNYNIL